MEERLNAMIAADHVVSETWISDAGLEANPGLVRAIAVKPPLGSGRVRSISIGDDASVNLQPCGETHVGSTCEIGHVAIPKVEKKGRQNNRVRLKLNDE